MIHFDDSGLFWGHTALPSTLDLCQELRLLTTAYRDAAWQRVPPHGLREAAQRDLEACQYKLLCAVRLSAGEAG